MRCFWGNAGIHSLARRASMFSIQPSVSEDHAFGLRLADASSLTLRVGMSPSAHLQDDCE